MKICTKCKEFKEDNLFFKSSRNKSGLASWCKVCTEENKQKWRKNNRKKYLESMKAYNELVMNDPEKLAKRRSSGRKAGRRPNGRYTSIKFKARDRGYEFNLTKGEFMTFWGQDCHYCGDHIEGIGIDRVDNDKGYELSNCVPCCGDCNKMKMTKTIPEFIQKCKKILKRHSES